jgi:hypothetical protein
MLILQSASPIFSQTPKELDPKKWASELSKKDHRAQESVGKLDSILIHIDMQRCKHPPELFIAELKLSFYSYANNRNTNPVGIRKRG